MATKHVKISPITSYRLRTDYQKDRQRRKKVKLLIGTMIFLLVYGVFFKGTLAEDDDAPMANKNDGSDYEDSVQNVSSPGQKSSSDYYKPNRNNLSSSTNSLPFRPERVGHGTEHEQAGIFHFVSPTLTPFIHNVNYTNPEPKFRLGMDPIFSVVDSILNFMVPGDRFPEGYVEIRDDKNFYLGRRVHDNDWLPLLGRYWMVCILVTLFLVLIIAIPFIAVCYCCFCCHKRCGRHCPPCDEKPDKTRRLCYGIILFILIICLIFGVYVAFSSNRILETGFAESTKNVGRSSDDTCRFLTNTNNHLKHLFINNYEEMETQLTKMVEHAHEHIAVDLAEVSRAEKLDNLTRIFENMPKALILMMKLDKLEKEARFYASQLRDALRGIKRNLYQIDRKFCYGSECRIFFESAPFVDLDQGCLHYDRVPNVTLYVDAIKDIIKENIVEIPRNAKKKFKELHMIIKNLHKQVTPVFINTIKKGRGRMSDQAEAISVLMDKVVSDIHLKTMRSSHSFDDIYAKLGAYRNLTNVILCIVLLVILLFLVLALCFGCFTKRRHGYRDDCCNKRTGAAFLLIAILLIFLSFSIIALIGLFYFIFGLLAYHGACAPLRDTTSNHIFNSFDSYIDFQQLSPPAKTGYIGENKTDNPLPPIRLSTALNACRSNESIIDVLQMNHLFSIRNIELMNIFKKLAAEAAEVKDLPNTLKNFKLMTEEEKQKIDKLRSSNLSSYHSSVFKDEMCKRRRAKTSVIIHKLNSLLHIDMNGYLAYYNTNNQLKTFENVLERTLLKLIDQVFDCAEEIDDLILYKNLNFNQSLEVLLDAITIAEDFIQKAGVKFINKLTENLTDTVVKEFGTYKDYVVNETKYNVGRCLPLAYVYEHGVDIVCYQMVDPMNGFWMGVLLCCLLFLPILWVAHKLQCLYKKVGIYVAPVVAGCPECTGARGPIKPATVMVCSGGLGNKTCPCHSSKKNVPANAPRSKREKSGGNNENFERISERGEFFDVEAQQKIVLPRSSQAYPKRKFD